MKIVRYRHDGRERFGALEGDRIEPVEGELEALVRTSRAKSIPLDTVRLLAPVAPSKIVAAGLNYSAFVREQKAERPKEPLIFLKPSTAVIGPKDAIVYPPQTREFTRSKSFDTFAPLGPVIETAIENPDDLALTTKVNGELCQNARTSDLIFKTDFLVSFISCIMTLLPGDVISTGTPPGVGQIQPSDVIEIEIEGIGTLTNTVAAME
jgi:2-keto-4-pentenoate hydratase/2-oxohepta-3-ene-1,7-dioic acid hydratase in catechol pathway